MPNPTIQKSIPKACHQCQAPFTIPPEDLAFYDKISPVFGGKKQAVPPPTLCPDCRTQRRFSFRNERNLSQRSCALCKKDTVSVYSREKPCPVYCQDCWWSDAWDALEYGRDFDFNRPFFEQFSELLQQVPRISLINKQQINSEYCNFTLNNKNCYLLFGAVGNEDCYYSRRLIASKNTSDCCNVVNGELCYKLVDSSDCYGSAWLQDCSHCTDCFLGYDLKNCNNCFACVGLKEASYCIYNEQYTQEEYSKKVEELKKDTKAVQEKFELLKQSFPRKHMSGTNNENCTGNALDHSKNAQDCYFSSNLHDCRYVQNATNLKDGYDVCNEDNSELVLESVGSHANYQHIFCDISWFNKYSLYSNLCFSSENIFGCVGVQKKKYCILNKQYSKEEYEKLVPHIIQHMQQTGEWGEFFPMNISLFAYNESVAMETNPLTQEEVKNRGLQWKEMETPLGKALQASTCETCKKQYRTIPQEQKLYEVMKLPVPTKCPDCRYRELLTLRNPRKLYPRQCAKCQTPIQTTYAPNRPEVIYCEACYLQEVY